jgi:hypothetical protein
MTKDECIRQAIGRLGRIGYSRLDMAALTLFAEQAVEQIVQRDMTQVDGRGFKEKWDPVTHESTIVETQLHSLRLVRAYVYGPADVLWLEREVRRRAGGSPRLPREG